MTCGPYMHPSINLVSKCGNWGDILRGYFPGMELGLQIHSKRPELLRACGVSPHATESCVLHATRLRSVVPDVLESRTP